MVAPHVTPGSGCAGILTTPWDGTARVRGRYHERVTLTPALSDYRTTRDRLDAILVARSGELHDTPYRMLLLAIGVREKTAVLRLRRNQLQKEIVFENGFAVDCQSNIATESIGRFLVASGRITEDVFRAAMRTSASRQVHIEEVLTEEKLLTPSELYRALQQNLGRKLLEPFSWTSGRWEISYDVPPVESALRVLIPQLLVTGMMKVEPHESIEQALQASEGEFVVIGETPFYPLRELRLSDDHARVLEAVRGRVAVSELASRAQVPPEEVGRLLASLLALGAVSVGDFASTAPRLELDVSQVPEPERPTAPQLAPKAATPAPARTPETPAAKEEVMAAYLSFRRKDAFELLGLDASASSTDVTRAWLDFAERFRPTRFSEPAADGVREKAQEVFLAGARAYAELADPARRESLAQNRARRQANAEARKTEPIGESTAARRPLIDPEALWREGRDLAAKGKLREALSNFELASECDAQNATYAAEVAYCRFQLLISPAALTLKALKNAIRLDSRCALAYLYAGRVQKTLGNDLEGQAYIDRAERLMPALRG